jgi:hypothetical protein
MRSLTVLVIAATVLVTGGCDVLDPARPTAQADAEVFGNLLDVEASPDDPGSWILRVQVGAPRSVRAADVDSGKPTPEVEQGLVATVRVSADCVVIVDDRPGLLDDLDSGTEIVVLPVPGTTRMYGSNDLRLDADTVMDFATYGLWRLPKLETAEAVDVDDPALINSGGAEVAPIPVGDGTVLYFSAHLRPPASPDGNWAGTLRDGLVAPAEGALPVERSYRTELGDDGWSAPELVRFPELDESLRQRVTWVDADETVCLVTVSSQGAAPWVGRATREGPDALWSAPQRIEDLGGDSRDGVYLAGSGTKIVFVTNRGGGGQSDLFLFDPKIEDSPAPLQPPIFTTQNEWCARTGPKGELLFNRGDRQLLFSNSQIQPLRLPGPHRVPFGQASLSADGRWLFFCIPTFRSPEVDENIFVAGVGRDFMLGTPVPVDEWRP